MHVSGCRCPLQAYGSDFAGLAVLTLGFLFFYSLEVPRAAAGGPPVFLSKVQQKILVDRVEALGTLKANESVTISAQTTDIITKIHFQDGQRVNKGDVLADMSSAEERAQMAEAEASVREARDQLDRASPLAARGISSGAILSERKRDFEVAEARLAAAKSRISDRRITAPFSGIVGLRNISQGALVEPGTVITTIDDDSVMKLDFTIPATFLATMRTGLEISATAKAFGNKVFSGSVQAIDSRVDAITRSITVRATIPNPDGILRAGLLMTVDILKNKRQALVIPERAVISRGTNSFVYVVNPSADAPVVEKRKVTLGVREAGEVEITEGLSMEEHVVIDGTHKVKPGQKVTVSAIADGAQSPKELLEKITRGKSS